MSVSSVTAAAGLRSIAVSVDDPALAIRLEGCVDPRLFI
jgi:hypothetical protein